MKTVTIHLKGWKQILAGLLLLMGAYGGYTIWIQSGLTDKLPALVEARLKSDLKFEAATRHLPLGQANATPALEQAKRFEAEAKTLGGLTIVSINQRGLGGSVVVQVKFAVDGQPLPNGADTRYYRLKHSWFSGWYVHWKTTELRYRLGWL